MKHIVLLTSLLLYPVVATVSQENTEIQPQTFETSKPKNKAMVAVKVDPLSPEQTKAGLSVETLKSALKGHLEASGIQVNDSISQPVLSLRVRTIEAGFDYVSFLQLSLQEESMLVRNRSIFNATTWSQASMLSCRPEDLEKEVSATVSMMAETFEKEYLKSLES